MLEIRDLTFSYNKNNRFSFPDITLKNEHLLVVGSSGIGKTTFLQLIGGLLKPESGTIMIHGIDISKLSKSKIDRFRGRNIGFVFQKSHFIASLNLQENLLLIQFFAGLKQDKKIINDVLYRLNIHNCIYKYPRNLSQGQQQRASIAMAIINNPNLLLADEPTSSLDDENCKKVIDLLMDQSKYSGANLIIITHDARVKSFFNNILEL